MTALNFKDIFSGFIDANQKEWAHDRSESVGASEVFGCERQAWFKRFGEKNKFVVDYDYEPDWGATKRGDLLEEHFVVPAIRDHLPGAAKLIIAGRQQKTLFHGYNSATPDGIILGLDADALSMYGVEDIGPSKCVVFEIKTIDPRVSLLQEKDIHFGQVQTQIGIIRETTEYKPDYAIIIYVDASFLSRIKVFKIEYEPAVWKAAQARATKIMTTEKAVDMSPEGKIDGGCKFCPWTSSCALVTTGSIPSDNSKKATQETIAQLNPFIERYKEVAKAKKEAEANFEDLKMQVKEALLRLGTRKLKNAGRWSATWYQQAGQKRIDHAKLKEALGIEDLEEYKTQGDPFDVLKITLTAENTEGEVEND